MTTKTMLVVATVCAVCVKIVCASTFDDATGDHKFSTGGNWNGGYPGAGDDAKVGPLAAGRYTTDSGLSTGPFSLETGNATDIVIALGSCAWAATKWQAVDGAHAVFDGGTWTVSGDANPGYSGTGSFVCLTNGATMTVSGRTSVGWSGSDNILFLSGFGTKWEANGTSQAHLGNTVNSTRNMIYVNDGASFSTKSDPFSIGQDGWGNVFRVESGATAKFDKDVNIGRANADIPGALSGKGENRIEVIGGHVSAPMLRIGCRPCAPSNRVEVTGGGTLNVTKIEIGSKSAGENGNIGSSYNSLYVGDGGVLTAAVTVAAEQAVGYTTRGNVLTVSTNSIFVSTAQLTIGKVGTENGVLVEGARLFDPAGYDVVVGDNASSNDWFKAVDVDRMTFGNFYCGETGNGNVVEFTNVTNLEFVSLMAGRYSSNNTVTVSGAKSLTANDIILGRYCGSGNRMTIGVAETLTVPANGIKVGYGTLAETRDDPHCADDCHLRIFGCGENRLGINPFGLMYPGTAGSDCSICFDHIEASILGDEVTYPIPPAGCLSNFTYTIGGNSRITSSGRIRVNAMSGSFRAVVSGEGTEWTHGTIGSNNGYLSVGDTGPSTHFSVEDGAEMVCGDSTAAFGEAGCSSLTVGSGASMDLYRLWMVGSNNSLVISNGTLKVREECLLPTYTGKTTTAVDNEVRFLGSHPRLLRERGAIYLGAYANVPGERELRDTTLFFEVPAEGYAQPPVESMDGTIVVASSTKLTADVSAIEKTGGKILLMRAGAGIDIKDMECLGAALPSGARLLLKNNNKELWLKTPSHNALVILIQ